MLGLSYNETDLNLLGHKTRFDTISSLDKHYIELLFGVQQQLKAQFD